MTSVVNPTTGRMDYRGHAMNKASRVASRATSGQVKGTDVGEGTQHSNVFVALSHDMTAYFAGLRLFIFVSSALNYLIFPVIL